MLIFVIFVTLLTLVWIGVETHRSLAVIEDIRRLQIADANCPDGDYPAFPRAQVNNAYKTLDRALQECFEEERKWYTSTRWRQVKNGQEKPSNSDRHTMHEICNKSIWWEIMLMRLQFLLEANLRVRRGEWSISQAHFFYRELEPNAWTIVGEANSRLNEWCERLNSHSELFMTEYQEKMRPYEETRTVFLSEWKKQFDAMHRSRPLSPYLQDVKE